MCKPQSQRAFPKYTALDPSSQVWDSYQHRLWNFLHTHTSLSMDNPDADLPLILVSMLESSKCMDLKDWTDSGVFWDGASNHQLGCFFTQCGARVWPGAGTREPKRMTSRNQRTKNLMTSNSEPWVHRHQDFLYLVFLAIRSHYIKHVDKSTCFRCPGMGGNAWNDQGDDFRRAQVLEKFKSASW